jgi:hypothetical protein
VDIRQLQLPIQLVLAHYDRGSANTAPLPYTYVFVCSGLLPEPDLDKGDGPGWPAMLMRLNSFCSGVPVSVR